MGILHGHQDDIDDDSLDAESSLIKVKLWCGLLHGSQDDINDDVMGEVPSHVMSKKKV